MGSCTHAFGLRLAANADPSGRSVGQSRIRSSRGGHRSERTYEQGVPMRTTNVNGIELAYDVQGEGEPVLFIHGAIWADFLRPLAEQPAFSGFKRIRYHRRGYGESGGSAGASTCRRPTSLPCWTTSRWTGRTLSATPRCDDRSRTRSLLPRSGTVPGAARAAVEQLAGCQRLRGPAGNSGTGVRGDGGSLPGG